MITQQQQTAIKELVVSPGWKVLTELLDSQLEIELRAIKTSSVSTEKDFENWKARANLFDSIKETPLNIARQELVESVDPMISHSPY